MLACLYDLDIFYLCLTQKFKQYSIILFQEGGPQVQMGAGGPDAAVTYSKGRRGPGPYNFHQVRIMRGSSH